MNEVEVKWERVTSEHGPDVFRTYVHTGWLVASSTDPGAQITYVPDADRTWGYYEDDVDEEEDDEDYGD